MTDGRWEPGWYPDPWVSGQHRYWDGDAWTSDAFQSGPRLVTTGSPAAGLAPSPGAPRPPSWIPPTRTPPPEPLPPAPMEEPPQRRLSGKALFAVMLAVGTFAGFLIALGLSSAFHHKNSPAAASSTTIPSPQTAPTTLPGSAAPATTPTTTPSGSAGGGTGGSGLSSCTSPSTGSVNPTLSGVVLRQADVPSTATVQLLDCGNQVEGQPTLDLCNGTYPSESLRTARLQVVGTDANTGAQMSTEAVLYTSGAATAQAFSELQSTAAKCPGSPVSSPVGEQTTTTKFGPAPDGSWAQVAGVQRLAYDFTTTDATGTAVHSMAVYLRRGKLLMGVYFLSAESPVLTVDGKTTPADVVAVFEARISALPASAVNP